MVLSFIVRLLWLVMVKLIIFNIELFFLLISFIEVLKILLGEIFYLFLMSFIFIGLVEICFLAFILGF